MRFFLGIDGGQSSTTALIAQEDGLIVGSGKSGPCNHVSSSEAAAKFKRVITECLGQACEEAGLDLATVSFAGACCGMSGGAEDKASLIQNVLRTDQVRVVTDGEIGLTGALAGEPGIIVIAGTGSICFGRNAQGKLARAGGWGYAFGDEGSAFDIVRQALRAALRFEEGWGPETSLHRMLLEATGETRANAVLHLFYSDAWPRGRVAGIAKLVDGKADSVAQAILTQAAQALAMLAACVRRTIFSQDEVISVSYVGGVFQSSFLLDRFRRFVELSGCSCVDPIFDPAAGALLEAFQLCGLGLVKLKTSAHVKTLH